MLLSSHELETVERLCSHVVILHRGSVVADDSIARLRAMMELPTLEGMSRNLLWNRRQPRPWLTTSADSIGHKGAIGNRNFVFCGGSFCFGSLILRCYRQRADTAKLLGQFATIFAGISFLFAAPVFILGGNLPEPSLWTTEHLLIATTITAVGVVSILSWDSLLLIAAMYSCSVPCRFAPSHFSLPSLRRWVPRSGWSSCLLISFPVSDGRCFSLHPAVRSRRFDRWLLIG